MEKWVSRYFVSPLSNPNKTLTVDLILSLYQRKWIGIWEWEVNGKWIEILCLCFNLLLLDINKNEFHIYLVPASVTYDRSMVKCQIQVEI